MRLRNPQVYLAGPMTGLPSLNFPAFKAAAEDLRGFGISVYNPAEWEYTEWDTEYTFAGQAIAVRQVHPHAVRDFDLHTAFVDYAAYICHTADVVLVLPGWVHSPGATAEVALAQAIGKPVFSYRDHDERTAMDPERVHDPMVVLTGQVPVQPLAIKHEHDTRCCKACGTHARPHRGCVLR